MRATSTFALAVGAFLAPQALAGIFVTSPTATTSCQAGVACTVNWNDDGQAPTLAQIGNCDIGLWVGNPQQQTELQVIQPSYPVGQFASAVFLPDASKGPNFDKYFIRFTCPGLKDATGNPYESFSAMFALTGMTGQFDPSVSAQIAGITSAGGAAATTAAAPVTTAPAATTTPSTAAGGSSSASGASHSGSSASASGSAKPSTTPKPNSAVRFSGMGAAGTIGGVVALLFGLAL